LIFNIKLDLSRLNNVTHSMSTACNVYFMKDQWTEQ